MGLDLGFNDADAIVILAFSEDDPAVYVIEEYKQSGQDITGLAKAIRDRLEKYGETNFVAKVADAGGLGKKIVEELRNRHGIHLDPADKQQKWGFIKLMNDDFRNEKIKVLKDNCPCIIYEWENLDKVQAYRQNDPLKEVEDSRFDNHLADACLYAWREAYHFTFKSKPTKPDYGTPEYFQMESSQYLDQTIEQMKRQEDDEWGNW